MENVSEILWVILRSLSRDIENFSISVTNVECHIYCLCIDIYIVSTLLYETSTLTDRNNAIWDINALFDAVFLFQSNTCKALAISVEKMPQSLLKCICWLIDEKAYKAASEPYAVPIDN
jgi:hypothetical protein